MGKNKRLKVPGKIDTKEQKKNNYNELQIIRQAHKGYSLGTISKLNKGITEKEIKQIIKQHAHPRTTKQSQKLKRIPESITSKKSGRTTKKNFPPKNQASAQKTLTKKQQRKQTITKEDIEKNAINGSMFRKEKEQIKYFNYPTTKEFLNKAKSTTYEITDYQGKKHEITALNEKELQEKTRGIKPANIKIIRQPAMNDKTIKVKLGSELLQQAYKKIFAKKGVKDEDLQNIILENRTKLRNRFITQAEFITDKGNRIKAQYIGTLPEEFIQLSKELLDRTATYIPTLISQTSQKIKNDGKCREYTTPHSNQKTQTSETITRIEYTIYFT